ncbi:MAG: TetR/AcrR family transcriptional regulator [Defluviitaleaceae bacterium]|nr:TetR/AcrR family transcriptional regulator [Defluviitaleaceae bacterium]
MSKKQRLVEFNASNILAAAKELFSEKGVAQTTMDDIAKKAEYSKSTIYAYFESKDEILNYIVLDHLVLLKKNIEDCLRFSTQFPDSFFAICCTVARFYSEYPMYFETLLSEMKIPEFRSNTLLSQIYTLNEQICETIEVYLKICVTDGYVRELESPPQATYILWSAICGIIESAHKKENFIRHKMGISKEEFMKNGFQLLLESIRAGVGENAL